MRGCFDFIMARRKTRTGIVVIIRVASAVEGAISPEQFASGIEACRYNLFKRPLLCYRAGNT